jgi:hypothetical protein
MLFAALSITVSACSKVEERQYQMTWKSMPTIHEEWNGAEDIHLTFLDDPDRTFVIVSDDLGDYLRSLGTDTVTTTWRTTVYLYFIDDPGYLTRVGDIDTWDRKWSCWILW